MYGVKKLSDNCFRREVNGKIEVESALLTREGFTSLECKTKTATLMKDINVQGWKQRERAKREADKNRGKG